MSKYWYRIKNKLKSVHHSNFKKELVTLKSCTNNYASFENKTLSVAHHNTYKQTLNDVNLNLEVIQLADRSTRLSPMWDCHTFHHNKLPVGGKDKQRNKLEARWAQDAWNFRVHYYRLLRLHVLCPFSSFKN